MNDALYTNSLTKKENRRDVQDVHVLRIIHMMTTRVCQLRKHSIVVLFNLAWIRGNPSRSAGSYLRPFFFLNGGRRIGWVERPLRGRKLSSWLYVFSRLFIFFVTFTQLNQLPIASWTRRRTSEYRQQFESSFSWHFFQNKIAPPLKSDRVDMAAMCRASRSNNKRNKRQQQNKFCPPGRRRGESPLDLRSVIWFEFFFEEKQLWIQCSGRAFMADVCHSRSRWPFRRPSLSGPPQPLVRQSRSSRNKKHSIDLSVLIWPFINGKSQWWCRSPIESLEWVWLWVFMGSHSALSQWRVSEVKWMRWIRL